MERKTSGEKNRKKIQVERKTGKNTGGKKNRDKFLCVSQAHNVFLMSFTGI